MEDKSSEGSRSPLKDKPLRNPGQSTEEARRKLIEDKFEEPGLMAAFLIALAALEWARYAMNLPPKPWIFTVVAFAGIAYASWRLWRVRPRLRALRQAIDGEKAVGQFLERLRENGYKVFHDIVGENFNLDHVIIGPAGVMTIETKTWTKPTPNAQVEFDGEELTVGSLQPDRNPVIQAKAQASWLRRVLEESTGRKFDVRPVIVFPGWFVQQSGERPRNLWVLEPKALPGFLAHEPRALADEDINLASFHLSRFIRSQERRS